MATASNPVGHHTSHTMGNGASSSNCGAYWAEPHAESNTADQSSVLDASLRDQTANILTLALENIWREPGVAVDDSITENSSPLSSASEWTHREATTESTCLTPSLSSVGNTTNFKIIDSTLREGEQFATAHFSTAQKLRIAQALDDFGVDYIEVTSPAASKQSKIDCEAICRMGLKAKIVCHIRCNMDDAKLAVQTGVDGIHMCIGISAAFIEHSHGKSVVYIVNEAKKIVQYVKSHGIEIRFTGEDSFRSDFAEILALYALLDSWGVDRVGIADTTGGATSREVFDKIQTLRRVVGCDIETHFHNDTGCAIANAYVALEAGATHIDTTVLGIGERNGITPLGGLLASLQWVDREYVLGKYKIKMLSHLEQMVAQIVGVEIPFNNLAVDF